MEKAVKKIVFVLVVLFLGFYLLTQPVAMAALARDGWDLVVGLFEAIIRFFNALVS